MSHSVVLFAVATMVLHFSNKRPPSSKPACPDGSTQVDGPFQLDTRSASWYACEDLTRADGALILVSDQGDAEWFAKGYAPYVPRPEAYYYDDLNV